MRRTTSAAFTRALSAPNGIEPWAGRAVDPQPPPRRALLADGHDDLWPPRPVHAPAAGLGDHVVGAHRVELVLHQPVGAVLRRPPPRRPRRGRRACRAAASPCRARCLVATAIDAVRLSMSMAPRPQTSPSTSSPPNGIALPPRRRHRHDVGVAHQAGAWVPSGRCPRCGPRPSGGRASARSSRRRGRRPRGSPAARRPTGPPDRTPPCRRSRTRCGSSSAAARPSRPVAASIAAQAPTAAAASRAMAATQP